MRHGSFPAARAPTSRAARAAAALAAFALFASVAARAAPTAPPASAVPLVAQAQTADPAEAFTAALALTRTGRSDAAIDAWERLAREHPGSPEIRNNLAIALARAGRRDEARQMLQAAVRLRPDYASIRHNLGAEAASWLLIEQLPRGSTGRVVAMTQEQANTLITLGRPLRSPPPAALAAPPSIAAAPAAAATVPAVSMPAGATVPNAPEEAIALPVPSTSAAPAVPLAPAAPARATPRDRELAAALQRWASAWQARDVETYLAAYHADFAPASGGKRADWAAERRRRVLQKAWIRIGLTDVQWSASAEATTAVVRFTQDYTAPSLREHSRKQLTWRRTEQGWRIADERELPR